MIGEVDPTIINLTVFVLAVFRRLSRRMECNAGVAYSAYVSHQRYFRHYPGGRHACGRAGGNRLGRVAGCGSGNAGRD